MNEPSESEALIGTHEDSVAGDLARLLAAPVDGSGSPAPARIAGVVVGTLIGFADGGAIPLVTFPHQPGTAALPARATLTLHGAHIGRQAVLMFEGGDAHRPIVIGCLQDGTPTELSRKAGHVDIDADGEHLIVSAKDRIVLRCGKASITLTKEGKLILKGAYVSSESSGVLRIKGGSVQIN